MSLDADNKPSLISNIHLNGMTDENISSTLEDFVSDMGEFQKMITQ